MWEVKIITIILIILLGYVIFYFSLFSRTNKLSNRIGKYCVYVKKRSPLMNNLYCLYKGIIRSISLFIMKIPPLAIYIKQYEVYITNENKRETIPADFVATKLLVSFIFFVILIILGNIKDYLIKEVDVIFFILVGFVIPDIYYIIKYNDKKR